jgi:hypothetical protein
MLKSCCQARTKKLGVPSAAVISNPCPALGRGVWLPTDGRPARTPCPWVARREAHNPYRKGAGRRTGRGRSARAGKLSQIQQGRDARGVVPFRGRPVEQSVSILLLWTVAFTTQEAPARPGRDARTALTGSYPCRPQVGRSGLRSRALPDPKAANSHGQRVRRRHEGGVPGRCQAPHVSSRKQKQVTRRSRGEITRVAWGAGIPHNSEAGGAQNTDGG